MLRLKALGLVASETFDERRGGSHRDPKQMAAFLKRALNDAFRQVSDMPVKELVQRRFYDRLQSYGQIQRHDSAALSEAEAAGTSSPSPFSGGRDSTALLHATLVPGSAAGTCRWFASTFTMA